MRHAHWQSVDHNTRIAGFGFAVLMAVVVNGAMLMKFNGPASDAALAQGAQTTHVAVLDKVVVVGHRS